jgi:hypothetical protein
MGLGSQSWSRNTTRLNIPTKDRNVCLLTAMWAWNPVHGRWTNGTTFYIELGRWGDTKMYKTLILPVAFYACKTWSLALSEGQRLSVRE